MRRPRRRNRSLVYALYANAALLLAILVLLLTRGGPGAATAMAAPQPPPIAGGGGLFLMPAQFSINTWGCYLMDIDAQTLCAYQYDPGQKQLRLAAARHFRYDRMLKNYNAWPPPQEIQRLIQLEAARLRGQNPNPGDAGDEKGNGAAPEAPQGPDAPAEQSTEPRSPQDQPDFRDAFQRGDR